MAQTVQYSPKTGKKLNKGESVSYGGRTYTQGSSNILGTSPTKAKSSGSAAIRTLQESLNKKGANLKVDGIAGPLTKAAQAKYGGSRVNSNVINGDNKYTTIKGGGYTISKSQAKKKTFLGSIFGKVKDAINTVGGKLQSANAYSGYVLNPTSTYTPPKSLIGQNLANGGLPNFATGYEKATTFSGTPVNTKKIEKPIDEPTSANMDLSLGYGESPLNPDVTGLGGLTNILNTPKKTISESPAMDTTITQKTTGTDTSGNKVITTAESTPSVGTSTYSTNNASILNAANQANIGLNDTNGTAFMSNATKKGEFEPSKILNYANTMAKAFNTPEDATKFYNSPEGQKSAADYVAKGGKIEDIISKIQIVNNSITEPKTTAEFLAYDKNVAKQKTDMFNEQIATEAGWTQQQKDILLGKKDAQGNDILLGLAEQQKQEQQTRLDYYERKLNDERTSAREKSQYMIDKARAEFERQDAETEINRINAKAGLTEFLAKIGALRTDGNALLGIEKLEQAYQAQRQQLRSNFQLSEREIRMDMNDKINGLESDLEEKKFIMSQDLSKTEREVAVDLAKLEYDHDKTMNSYKFKYYEEIESAKEKAQAKATKTSEDWLRSLYDLSGWNQFTAADEEYKNTWIENALKSKKDVGSWVNQLTPGSISKSNVDKSISDFEGGGVDVNNNDPLGLGI